MSDINEAGLSSSSEEENNETTQYPQMNADLSMPGQKKKMIDVLVTGFGPFRHYPVNSSWEAVKELEQLGIAHNVNLITEEIPVDYQAVQRIIPELWKKHEPHLVVHVGVSSMAEEITFETLAHNDGYVMDDITGNPAPSECYIKNGQECLRSEFDIDELCDVVNKSSCLAMAVASTDAGRYLCEFIFYASLRQSTSQVSFIHVPELGKPYTSAELGHAIKCSIQAMLKQMDLYHPLPLPNSELMEHALQKHEQQVVDQLAK